MKAAIKLHLKDTSEELDSSKKTEKKKQQPKFTIKIKELKAAFADSYMGLGTPYAPIQVDNFIDLENQEYATIYPNTQITAHLTCDDFTSTIKNMQLICCKVTNIGREYNDELKGGQANSWATIFELNRKNGKRIKSIYPAPDGTLYIAANSKGKCRINTCEKISNAMLAYSILFSATLKLENDKVEKSYYFVLDPVVKIRAQR